MEDVMKAAAAAEEAGKEVLEENKRGNIKGSDEEVREDPSPSCKALYNGLSLTNQLMAVGMLG